MAVQCRKKSGSGETVEDIIDGELRIARKDAVTMDILKLPRADELSVYDLGDAVVKMIKDSEDRVAQSSDMSDLIPTEEIPANSGEVTATSKGKKRVASFLDSTDSDVSDNQNSELFTLGKSEKRKKADNPDDQSLNPDPVKIKNNKCGDIFSLDSSD
jgi:hypothetical protein